MIQNASNSGRSWKIPSGTAYISNIHGEIPGKYCCDTGSPKFKHRFSQGRFVINRTTRWPVAH